MKKKAELFLLIIMFFSGLISCFSFVDYFWFSCDVRSIIASVFGVIIIGLCLLMKYQLLPYVKD
jgi:hypothetical protein